MVMSGLDTSKIKEVSWNEDFEKYNKAIEKNYVDTNILEKLETIKLDVEEFDRINQENWFIPDEYKTLDIKSYVLERTPTHAIDRVNEELNLYDKYNIIDVLKVCIYIIDTLRKNNIVWGVGRGSSVASYVLYLIGVHKIDSIKYELDINEFLR
jgi:DNA polymerase III alpha subunit